MFPCFFGGLRSRLVREGPERLDQPRPGVPRVDHVVDVAARGRGVRVGELRGVLLDQPGGGGGRIVGLRDLLLEEDLDRALGAHHRDLRRGPGEVEVAPDVLGAHDVVGATVRLAGDHGELGHRRLAVGVEQLGAVLDDAAVLLGHAGQEPGHVHEGHDRQVEAVAEADEARGLERRVDVEHPGEHRRLVGHDRRPAARPAGRSRPGCCRRSPAAPRGSSPSSTTRPITSCMSYGLLALSGIRSSSASSRRSTGSSVGRCGRIVEVVQRQEAEQLADRLKALGLGVVDEVGDPAGARRGRPRRPGRRSSLPRASPSSPRWAR